MKKELYPLISCLCVTREKPELLKRAVSCFLNQTYPNKELIIIYEDDDLYTKAFAKSIDFPNVFFYEIVNSKEITLGYLRNYSIEQSHGEFICQWDDDDWYHIARIEYQYEILIASRLPACVMTQWLIFDQPTGSAYLSNKRLWEGSLLCKKEVVLKRKYDNLKIGEDTSLIEWLFQARILYLINDTPNLYIYIYHGNNTWNRDHWKNIFNYSSQLKTSDALKIASILKNYKDGVENSLAVDILLSNPIFEE